MNKSEATAKLKSVLDRRANGLSNAEFPQFIDDCLELLEHHPEKLERGRMAVILSGVIFPGLADRVAAYISAHPDLPTESRQVLEANYMRMNGR